MVGKNSRWQVGAVVMLTVGLTACTSNDGKPHAEEPALASVVMAMEPAAVDPNAIDFPLNPYAKDANLDVIGRAVDILQHKCFLRYGVDLPLPNDPGSNQWPSPTWDWYGLWDEETARVYGYQSPPLRAREALMDHVAPDLAPLLIGEIDTFAGQEVPEGGCQAEAYRALGMEDDVNLVNPEGLQRDAVTRARQHSAVEELIDDWATCVAQAGWEFSDPSEPFGSWQTGAELPSSEELTMAVTDINCKRDTGLLQVWVAAEYAYQERLVEENATALAELERWRDDARRRAGEIVAGG